MFVLNLLHIAILKKLFQYGLYSGFMGSFVYIFLGSTKDITVGPTAIMALMTQTYVLSYGPDFAVLLTFLSGCVISLFGLLQLGKFCCCNIKVIN